MKEAEIFYKDLSYQIVGILFKVFNEIGYGYQEKIYERAIARCFDVENIYYENQKYFSIIFKGKIIGKYYFDFIVERKIVLEIKQGNKFSIKNIEQIKGYLKATGLKLAILAHFTSGGVKIFRAFNPNYRKNEQI